MVKTKVPDIELIQQYTKKNGEQRFMFKLYLGMNPVTGNPDQTTRRNFETIDQALLEISRLRIEYAEQGLKKAPKQRTYNDVFEEWWENIYTKDRAESTYTITRSVFKNHIIPKFGKLKIQKINTEYCQRAVDSWVINSPKRFHRYANYAEMVFKYAIKRTKEITINPMEDVIIPDPDDFLDEDEEEWENFYDRNELLLFLDKLEKKYPYKRYALFLFLAHTGFRKSELLALTWRDINLKEKTVSVKRTLARGEGGRLYTKKPKTKKSKRTISIDDTLIKVLKRWKLMQREELFALGHVSDVNQLVFSKPETNTWYGHKVPQAWLDSFYNKHRSMKVITPHGFRHTHASILFEAGATMKQVQERLGHSSIKTTMNVYVHVTSKMNEQSAELFDNFMYTGNESEKTVSKTVSKKYPH